MTSVSFQRSQDRERRSQNKRSDFLSFGRGCLRFKMASCCRSARFSSASSERSFSAVRINKSSRRIVSIIAGKCRTRGTEIQLFQRGRGFGERGAAACSGEDVGRHADRATSSLQPRTQVGSRCLSVVVPKHTAQSLAALDPAACATKFVPRVDEPIVEPLMVSLFVQTSIVVMSTDASTSQWALRNVCHVFWRFRSGAGSMPFRLRMLATPESEILWPRFARAPWIRS
jgi:hypothetical protein